MRASVLPPPPLPPPPSHHSQMGTLIHHGTHVPTYQKRLECAVARAAYYAYWLHFATHPDFVYGNPTVEEVVAAQPMCQVCGIGTGNLCDECDSPLCNLCNNNSFPCPNCSE